MAPLAPPFPPPMFLITLFTWLNAAVFIILLKLDTVTI